MIDVVRLRSCAPEGMILNKYHKENWRALTQQYYNMKCVPSDRLSISFTK